MCTLIKKYANNGFVNISTANSNLDGTGTLGTVLTAASSPSNGTTISSIIIKATGDTSEGMVRLFTYDGTNYFLWKEVYIPENTATTVVESFQASIVEELSLNPGETLLASTQNAEGFNVFANASDWTNCTCSNTGTCAEDRSLGQTGFVAISSANTNRDGTGNISNMIVAPTGITAMNCTQILKIGVKATATVSEGLIGIYIYNGTTYYLIWEVPVSAATQTGVEPAYETQVYLRIGLKTGYAIGVSTQISNSFNVFTFASLIINCACG